MSQKFRKLDIDLPRQPLVDQGPWQVAGILLLLIILVFAVFSYYNFTGESEAFLQAADQKSQN
jgi:hypothetical protein